MVRAREGSADRNARRQESEGLCRRRDHPARWASGCGGQIRPPEAVHHEAVVSSIAAPRAERGWVAKTAVLARKDMRIELRTRDTLPPMLAFSFAVTLLLAFTLPTSGRLEAP